jgi:hypothetical protein
MSSQASHRLIPQRTSDKAGLRCCFLYRLPEQFGYVWPLRKGSKHRFPGGGRAVHERRKRTYRQRNTRKRVGRAAGKRRIQADHLPQSCGGTAVGIGVAEHLLSSIGEVSIESTVRRALSLRAAGTHSRCVFTRDEDVAA